MKLRTAELKQKELAVAREREALEELREELDREKERLSSTALRLKTRAQEVEAFSKVISHYTDPCVLDMFFVQRVFIFSLLHSSRQRSMRRGNERCRRRNDWRRSTRRD